MFRSIAILAAWTTAAVCAQEPAAKPVRTDLMPVSLGTSVAMWYVNKGEVKKLEAFESAMGTPVFYRGSQQLSLYASQEDARPRKEGEAPVKPVASVTLPTGSPRVLLLFATGKENKPIVRAYGVEDEKLKAGDYRVLNLAPVAVVGQVGGQKVTLKPGQTTDLSSAAWREKGEDLEVLFGFVRDGKQEVVYSTIWSHYPERRNYIFLLPSSDSASPLDVRKFHDVPSVKSIGFEPEKPDGE